MKGAVFLFLVATTAGYLAGRPHRSKTVSSGEERSPPAVERPLRVPWEKGDFAAWIDAPVADPDAWYPVIAPPDLSGWDQSELRAALEEALGPGMTVLGQTDSHQLAGLLIKEWMGRDLDGVVAWFESLRSDEMKRRAAGSLGAEWPVERGEEALDFAVRNGLQSTVRGGIVYPQFLSKALGAAARSGPEAVARMVESAAAAGMDSRYSRGVEYPVDFDFAALAVRPEVAELIAGGAVFFAGEWASRDPEGSFEHLIGEPGRADCAILESWLSGATRRQTRGDPTELVERYHWLAARISNLEPGLADGIADSLTKSYRLAEAPAELGEFVGRLEEPELRQRSARQGALEVMERSIGVGKVMAYLERAGNPEERVEILQSVMVDDRPQRFGGLSTRDETLLRESLSAWGVNADRGEELVKAIMAPRKWK